MLPRRQDSAQMIGKLTTHASTMMIPPDNNEDNQQQQRDNYDEGGGNVILPIPRGDAAGED
jgi:hypothetical protein